jgi:uncharacterized membrane protein
MNTGRLEAFSDGVIAIIITIMVLELKVPHGADWEALQGVLPVFFAYVLSFVNVAIFWNNHHHMLHVAEKVNGNVLWANMFLLFCLSLVPFAIRWMDEAHFAAMPVAFYGVALTGAAIGYIWLERAIIACDGPQSKLAQATRSHWKEITSFAMYIAAVPLAFVDVWIAVGLYVATALLWLVPDKRIEKLA